MTITIDPMTVTIGAEIGGVDLAGDLSDDTIEEIRQALLEWKVIFFRDQHGLDRARPWDNRATQHVVSNDFLPAKRVMERVTVVGDKPY